MIFLSLFKKSQETNLNSTITHRLKIQIVIVIMILLSILAFALAPQKPWISFLGHIPCEDIGWHLIEILFIILVFEIYLRNESERKTQSLLFSAKIVRDILEEKKIEEIMESCFWRITGDNEFSKDLVKLVRNGAILPKRRMWHATYDATLIELPKTANKDIREMFFSLHLAVSYQSEVINPLLRFVLATSNNQYNQFRQNEDIEWKWLQLLPTELAPFAGQFFKIETCSIDGELLTRKDHDGTDCEHQFAVPMELINKKGLKKIEFSMVALIRKNGHLLQISFDVPTKGASITFDYSRVPFDFVNVIDALTTPGLPKIQYIPNDQFPRESHRVAIEVQTEWIIPKSNVAFIWRLKAETKPSFIKLVT